MLGVKYLSILFGMSFAHYALRLLQKYQQINVSYIWLKAHI